MGKMVKYFQGEIMNKEIGDFTKQIDFEETSLDKRVTILHDILNTQETKDGIKYVDKYFEEYFNTEDNGYFNVHPNTRNVTSENDFICRQLQFMANYLLYSKENLQYNDICDNPIETDNTQYKAKQTNSSYEEKLETNTDKFEGDLKQEKVKQYKVQTAYIVTPQDLKKYPELQSMQDDITNLRDVVIKNEQREKDIKAGRIPDNTDTKPLLTSKDRINIRKLMGGIKHNQIALKKSLIPLISFNNIPSGRPCYTFWDNTGYYNEEGEYVQVSYNKLELSNHKHIYQLLRHYGSIKEMSSDNLDCDYKYLLWELENLVDTTPLSPSERDVVIWKIDEIEEKEILERLEEKYDIELSQQRLSKIWSDKIPKMVAETFIEDKLDWHYIHKIKGKYKRCSKCKKVLLLNKRNYNIDRSKKDGYKASCKKCR